MTPAEKRAAKPAKTDPPPEDPTELGFDEHLERLESIVGELEEGGLGLEASIERYRDGLQHLKHCHGTLERYKRQVEELTRDAESTLRTFDADPDVRPEDRRG